MFGNPYLPQANIDRIDQQIKDLERLKNSYQNIAQPTQNIINVGGNSQSDFKAQFVNDNEKVEEILVNCKTAFISPKNGYLKIKDLNGDITEYILTKPKTEQELYIEELERKIKDYEYAINTTNNEIREPSTNVDEQYEPTTKNGSSRVSKKS